MGMEVVIFFCVYGIVRSVQLVTMQSRGPRYGKRKRPNYRRK